eukprot:Seg2845.2 transcript_id=Seg2845.2/GoldUCD/mRNA.D3Y31 product="Laminin-like protein epi-1" protein_id=Seg2845.2/GoldUCD/D3Y31
MYIDGLTIGLYTHRILFCLFLILHWGKYGFTDGMQRDSEVLVSNAGRPSLQLGSVVQHTDDVAPVKRIKRRTCTCNPTGTVYNLCHPLASHRFSCICKRGYAGKFCKSCSAFSYGYPNCKTCSCNLFGSKTSKCNGVTGQCDCKSKMKGRACDRCSHGNYRFPSCTECNCPLERTTPQVCDYKTGACLCKDNYEGESCEKCKPGYYGYPECKSIILACKCNPLGSASLNCNITTGQCDCKYGFTGINCNECSTKDAKGPKCETAKRIGVTQKLETIEEAAETIASIFEERRSFESKVGSFCARLDSCRTKAQESTCKDLSYNDTESRISTCVPCGCFGEGTLGSVLKCEKLNGKCPCKSHVTGRACDSCEKGFYDLGHGKVFGCGACQCNAGGSRGISCDNSGKCRCKKNIEGAKCDRLKNGKYYQPDHSGIKFEMEDSKLDNGRPVAYGYSQAEFPRFSWKGYVAVGDEQTSMTLKIIVPKASHYKVLLSYILASNQPAVGTVRINDMQNGGTAIYESSVQFNPTDRHASQGKYIGPNGLNNVFMKAGEWKLRFSSNSVGLYLDHVVLVPKAYFDPEELLQPLAQPCHIGIPWYETCSMYSYVPLESHGAQVIKGNTGLVRRGDQGTTSFDKARQFDDPDVMTLLHLKSLAMISSNQAAVYFNISVETTGLYNIIVEYFNADRRVYTLEVFEGKGKRGDHWLASTCPYKFFCRSVILNDTNIPTSFNFTRGETVKIMMTGTVEGMIGIHSLTVISADSYSNEYLKPKFSCLTKNGKCLEHAQLPSLKGALQMMLANASQSSYAVSLNAEGWWVVVLQYKQPKYTMFAVEMTLKGREGSTNHFIDVEYCPSRIGCRVKITAYAKEGELLAVLKSPRNRDFTIDSIYVLRDSKLDDSKLKPSYVDISTEYKKHCVDSNLMPIPNQISSLCRNAFFTQIVEFNNGAPACSCSRRGSRGLQCSKHGGQCKCGPNIIGRRCQSCRAGFFNYPYCRNCRCFMAGSQSPECNRNGRCHCKPRYGGVKCNKCKSALFYAFPECKPCNCNTQGSLGLFCRAKTGQCQCLHNFRGRKCDQCQIGFYDFPKCKQCNCNAAGIKVGIDGDGCSPGKEGRCSCKENVDGANCDRCKDLFYALQITNPLGCSPCNCDTAGTLNSIATCDKRTGQCPCKPNVESSTRSCDTCKDGFYGLDKNNVFGCKACDCNEGGSSSKTCDKKTGQCKCRPSITGRRCDRMASGSYYVPTIQHLKYPAKDGMATNGKLIVTERISGFINLAQHKVPIQWKVDLPQNAKYFLLVNYQLGGKSNADVKISISYAAYQSTVYQTTKAFKPTSDSTNSGDTMTFILKENKEEFPLNLYSGSYFIRLLTNSTKLYVNYISLIPESYLTGKSLISEITEPCTVFSSSKPCVRYSYLEVPRKDVYTLELEGTGRQNAEVLDRSTYPTLNFNGAVIIRRAQPYTISFRNPAYGSFYLLLQYFNPQNTVTEAAVLVQEQSGTDIGHVPLARCPFVFGCRQVVLEKSGAVKIFSLSKGSMYTVTFAMSTSGFVALDLFALIPSNTWSVDYHTNHSHFCVASTDASVPRLTCKFP